MTIKRDAALAILARHHTDQIVVAVYQAAFEWIRLKPDALNFISVGAMGQASSHALGFALGMPERRVLVFDGDGSLLMNLGSLVTIGGAAPANLVHFVFENGCYEANGGHPIPAQSAVDFRGLALAAGYRAAHTIETTDELDAMLPALMAARGPVLVDLRVEAGAKVKEDYEYMHGRARIDFREKLRESPGAPR